jgi:SAM-dependent methyltransferase
MKIFDKLHEKYVYDRRAQVLSDEIAKLIPENATVLDVGCGDGLISSIIQSKRPDINIEGVDVLIRPNLYIPVKKFDGKQLPYPEKSFETVIFIDVLHHTNNPTDLLSEAYRVTYNSIIIKDHLKDSFFAGPLLHFMDWVGNKRYGVAITANYWPTNKWKNAFEKSNLKLCLWDQNTAFFSWWSNWLFGRALHFIARLTKAT